MSAAGHGAWSQHRADPRPPRDSSKRSHLLRHLVLVTWVGAVMMWPRVAAASTSTCSAYSLLCQEPAPLGVSCESQDDVGWRKVGPSP